jgi:Predicted transcriptional regulators
MDLTSIGGRIKQYRKEAHLSQSQLAEMIDVSTKYVSVLERSAKPPSLETLINIANALNISTDMLLCDTLNVQFNIKQTIIGEKIKDLPTKEQSKIMAVVDVLIEQAQK